jgi:superfamily II DNA or RNA helicase
VDNQYFIECPRGTLRNIYEFIAKKGFTPTVKQNRLKLPEHEVEFKRELWSHQTEAVQSAIKRSQGVIVSPAGSGKTTIGCAIIAQTKQPTLWVTHKIELVDQTKAEIIACTDIKEEEIGVLGNCQKQEGSKVTICTIQTISLMDLDEIKNNYGCVIVDEVHHCPAKTWFDTINCLPAFYRFGLTATINREDGLTDLIHMVVGKTIYEVSREDLIHAKKILPAQVFTIDNYTEYECDSSNRNFCTQLTTDITEDGKRNQLIANTVKLLTNKNDQILILTERVDHVKYLSEMIKAYLNNDEYKVIPFTAKNKLKDKLEGKFIICATYGKAEEGLNIPLLNALVFATPTKNERKLIQSIGRTERNMPGKKRPSVIDIVDKGCGVTLGRWKNRKIIYDSLGIQYKDITGQIENKLPKAA